MNTLEEKKKALLAEQKAIKAEAKDAKAEIKARKESDQKVEDLEYKNWVNRRKMAELDKEQLDVFNQHFNKFSSQKGGMIKFVATVYTEDGEKEKLEVNCAPGQKSGNINLPQIGTDVVVTLSRAAAGVPNQILTDLRSENAAFNDRYVRELSENKA